MLVIVSPGPFVDVSVCVHHGTGPVPVQQQQQQRRGLGSTDAAALLASCDWTAPTYCEKQQGPAVTWRSLHVVLKHSFKHIAAEAVHRSAAIYRPALAMPFAVQPVAFVSVAIVFKKCAVALNNSRHSRACSKIIDCGMPLHSPWSPFTAFSPALTTGWSSRHSPLYRTMYLPLR